MAIKRGAKTRIKRVAASIKTDALLVSDLINIRYLTGFTGSNAHLVVGKRKSTLFTDSRYTVQAKDEVKGAAVAILKGPWTEAVAKLGARAGYATLGFEPDALTYSAWAGLKKACKSNSLGLKALKGEVEALRIVKEPTEIGMIREAIRIADSGFLAARRWIRPGKSEIEVADNIYNAIKKNGALGPSFDIIVASGERSAMPHAVPGEKKIKRGELVVVDMGALYEGYSSDQTRTYITGRPTGEQLKIYNTVREANLRAVEAVRPGVKASEVDKAAREVIKKAGFGKYFGHGTGHGVGLKIHEAPVVGPKSNEELKEGMVFTIEPGVYLPGKNGVRIEDMVLVTANGAELLTTPAGELEELS